MPDFNVLVCRYIQTFSNNPTKVLKNVNKLLQKFKGREQQLLYLMAKKYGHATLPFMAGINKRNASEFLLSVRLIQFNRFLGSVEKRKFGNVMDKIRLSTGSGKTRLLIGAETRLLRNNILVVLSKFEDVHNLTKTFFGSVTTDLSSPPSFHGKTVYLCGDVINARGLQLDAANRVFVVKELSCGYDDVAYPLVAIGRVPVQMHGMGVFYPRFFDSKHGFFNKICIEHKFQSLTESNKPNKAYRTGIYITSVKQDSAGHRHFNLLRCSSNLSGPTGNFRATDKHIVDALNQEAACLFADPAPLNHVLAQVYHNIPAQQHQKQKKATIKAHADKTKDMPKNGFMAFCTFYNHLDKLTPLDEPFDYGYRSRNRKCVSGLTTLFFRLKKCVQDRPGCTLTPHFSVKLFPESVFFMPLSTNRLYTHEIRPSRLLVPQLPTRLGYVVRCSSTKAVHKNGQTFIKRQTGLEKLQQVTPEGIRELREVYAKENATDQFIDYGQRFPFSMNKGDYSAPLYEMADEFRQYTIATETNPFHGLLASVDFEPVVKGRQGTVLVRPAKSRGIPIVRTTTRYKSPAQCFQPAHVRLAEKIRQVASLPEGLNNALVECYSNEYATMGMHSDQAQDLQEQSFIAVYSCYKHPELTTKKAPRKLVVKSKYPGGNQFEIPMTHNSVIVFSTETNRNFKHKIVLDRSRGNPPDNQWLGLTFRTSKTFVNGCGQQARLQDGTPLTLATAEQRTEFYRMRGRENRETDFDYPPLSYTISDSDMMLPYTKSK